MLFIPELTARILRALRRAIEVTCLMIFAALSALPPTAISMWVLQEILVRLYMQDQQIIFRSELVDDYLAGFELLVQWVVIAPLCYIAFFLLFFRLYLRMEARHDQQVSAASNDVK